MASRKVQKSDREKMSSSLGFSEYMKNEVLIFFSQHFLGRAATIFLFNEFFAS